MEELIQTIKDHILASELKDGTVWLDFQLNLRNELFAPVQPFEIDISTPTPPAQDTVQVKLNALQEIKEVTERLITAEGEFFDFDIEFIVKIKVTERP